MLDKTCNFALCISEIDEEAMCEFQFARSSYREVLIFLSNQTFWEFTWDTSLITATGNISALFLSYSVTTSHRGECSVPDRHYSQSVDHPFDDLHPACLLRRYCDCRDLEHCYEIEHHRNHQYRRRWLSKKSFS